MTKELYSVNNGNQLDILKEEGEWSEREDQQRSFIEQWKTDANDKSIICITVQENELKEIALNFFIRRGFYCVQNDAIASIDYSQHENQKKKKNISYVLTFAKGDRANRFIN